MKKIPACGVAVISSLTVCNVCILKATVFGEKKLSGVFPVSIIFGQMTSRKRPCTGEAAVTFRRNSVVIFIDLPEATLKRKLCDPKASVEKPRFLTCDVFVLEIFLR